MPAHQSHISMRALCFMLALYAGSLNHMMLCGNLVLRSMAALRRMLALQMVG